MSFTPQLAERRFGYGLSPYLPAPSGIEQMLDHVQGADPMKARFAIDDYWYIQDRMMAFNRFVRHARENKGSAEGEASHAKARETARQVTFSHARWFAQTQLRRIHTVNGFRERLVAFWADHFTAKGKQGVLRRANPLYVEEAVRPHITGSFADLLWSCVHHPLMLQYLDQESSVGPNSTLSRRNPGKHGLNENLAREVLELHTLGVGGPYGQDDVRALAGLMAGLSRGRDFGFAYRAGMAEPGPQTILGIEYGSEKSVARIEAAIRDLATHPVTAAHIARKLAVHFVADTPPPALVDELRETFLLSGGNLMAVYEALLRHPRAWDLPATNIRPPGEFVSAALRALAVTPEEFAALDFQQIRRYFFSPFTVMGQQWLEPKGPDGFEEKDSAWVTPQGIAGRMEWAMQMPRKIKVELPDPRSFAEQALGHLVPPRVAFAASAAESRAEAVGLVLMSPAFQRR
ncbi:DUF1800 domain-containing protein [Sulfitobacter sp. TSTF-M16]|uniref:DUF1800 domain-containing protein n=1 Tax=Sulfitobacter aestuariivivens TaxID=2766981 RepID=A0A927D6T8_9RHOB|nr:DUF1800 domain-containing protein [Sulfitobacter aestuariivivens]MBD3666300.1 DUF1800 domain-containing protein [Sulfitobacter aestuariivivens]